MSTRRFGGTVPPSTTCYTDYPLWLAAIPFLDRVNRHDLKPPPGEPEVYRVELVSYDGNKYAVVQHDRYGLIEMKRGYLYWHRRFRYLRSRCLPESWAMRYYNAIPFDERGRRGVICL